MDGQTWLQGLQGTETDRQTYRFSCTGCKGCEVQRQLDRQVWLQGFQRLLGTETDRQVWLQGLQRLQGTEKGRQTGMVARVAKVARCRDR